MIEPCPCRFSRKDAMAWRGETGGQLVWSPDSSGRGPIETVTLDGERDVLTFGHAWIHFDEQLARDHARIRHLEFVVAADRA